MNHVMNHVKPVCDMPAILAFLLELEGLNRRSHTVLHVQQSHSTFATFDNYLALE